MCLYSLALLNLCIELPFLQVNIVEKCRELGSGSGFIDMVIMIVQNCIFTWGVLVWIGTLEQKDTERGATMTMLYPIFFVRFSIFFVRFYLVSV